MSWLAMSTIQSIPKARPTVPELWFELTVNQKHLLLMCDGRVCVCVCVCRLCKSCGQIQTLDLEGKEMKREMVAADCGPQILISG